LTSRAHVYLSHDAACDAGHFGIMRHVSACSVIALLPATDYEVLESHGAIKVVRQPSPWSLTAGFAERTRDFLESLAR
jgi:hypothetical protein